MAGAGAVSPLSLDAVEEVPLARVPLLRVIAQVRFSETPALSSEDNGAKLAAALPDYPVGRTVQGLTLVLPQGGSSPPTTEHQTIRQFLSIDGHWTVGVAKDFVSLETDEYTSRSDFCRRLAGIVASVMEIAPPPVIDRIGIRYVDRWSDPEFLDDIGNMLIPEILGPFRSVETGSGIRIEHTIGNHRLLLDSGAAIQFRSGFIPAGAALDQAIPAADTASWILDIDVFQEWPSPIAFAGESINNHVRQFADYAHSVFRWATTAEFIERYQEVGGK